MLYDLLQTKHIYIVCGKTDLRKGIDGLADEMTLRSLGIRNFDHVIVAIGEDIQASILVTLMVKEMGVPNIDRKRQVKIHARVLEKIGADRVVHPERDMGIRIAHNLVSKNILDYLELSDKYSLAEIRVSILNFSTKH
ncbi:hypothetical protein EfmJHP36_12550 [Enterococcus faecium]|nr:hypothetical protein EfmJHP36_12550 [Enterococcus faecium]